MSTLELKSNLHNLIDAVDDSKILNAIYALLSKKTTAKEVDFWNEFSEEQKAEIKESIAQADRSELIPHEQVMKEIKSRYKI